MPSAGRRRTPDGRLAAVILALGACASAERPPPPSPVSPAVAPGTPVEAPDAVAAFARLYGVVRWFHPADEAEDADWDAVAVAGVEVALEAHTRDELRQGLTRVLGPLAPTMQLWTDGEAPPARLVAAGDGPVMAWQHLGWSFGGDQPIYRSLRLGRPEMAVTDRGEITATNGDEADGLEGRELRVSARVRVELPEAERGTQSAGAWLWLCALHGPADETTGRVGWDSPRLDRAGWHRYEVTTRLPDDATWYVYGVRLAGRGVVWADDFRVEVHEPDGSWRELATRDAGFDDEERWWVYDGLGYDAEVVDDRGGPVLRLTHQGLAREELFPEAPALGEVYEAPIGAGLVARVPIALPSSTAGEATGPAAPASPPSLPRDRDDRAVHVAAGVVAWNVLRHFHPYEEDLHVDWEARLREVVAGTMAAGDRAAVVDALWALQVGVPDGHAFVGHAAVTGRSCGFAVRWVRVGDDLVVTNTGDEAVAVGDRVAAVDGVPIAAALARARERVSGSPWFRDAFSAERLSMGPCGAEVHLDVERGGERRAVTLTHVRAALPLFDHLPVERTPGGVMLVDLNTAAWSELEPSLADLAAAPGVIFDLREYPAPGTLAVIEHLLGAPDRARGWMRIPEIIRPGQVDGWERHEWGLEPAAPRLRGRVVFLTSGLGISAAESILGLVKAEGLATLLGQRTAGTNGNATGAVLPGGYWIQFTGMRVVQPDGSPFHLVGIAPDVEAGPTLAGLLAGRDEVRDAAVDWLSRGR